MKAFEIKPHVEISKDYELDKNILKKIYKISPKEKIVYNLYKKNIIYNKEYIKSSNENSNIYYYSSYQYFRDYLCSGYNFEFLNNEIENIKSLISSSKNIRNMFANKLYKKTNNQNFLNFTESLPTSTPQISRKNSTVFDVGRLKKMGGGGGSDYFLSLCSLLKSKDNGKEDNNDRNKIQFLMHSEWSRKADIFNIPQCESLLNVKYENKKTRLIQLFSRESAFVNTAIEIRDTIKKNNIKNNTNNINNVNTNNNTNANTINGLSNPPPFLPQKTRTSNYYLRNPKINSIFFGRDDSRLRGLSNLVGLYIGKHGKDREEEMFDGMYRIIGGSTGIKRFLSYLFSISPFFQHIFLTFSQGRKKDPYGLEKIEKLKDSRFLGEEVGREIFGDSSEEEEKGEEYKEYKEDENNNSNINNNISNNNNNIEFVEDSFCPVFGEGKDSGREKNINSKKDPDSPINIIENLNLFFDMKLKIKISFINENLSSIIAFKKLEEFNKKVENIMISPSSHILLLNNKGNFNIIERGIRTPIFTVSKENSVFYWVDNEYMRMNNNNLKEKFKKEKVVLICQESVSEIVSAYMIKMSNESFNKLSSQLGPKELIKESNFFISHEAKGKESESEITSNNSKNEENVNKDNNKSSSETESKLSDDSTKNKRNNNFRESGFTDNINLYEK